MNRPFALRALGLVAAVSLLPVVADARRGPAPLSANALGRSLSEVATFPIEPRDVEALRVATDRVSREDGAPLQFADPVAVSITPATHGTWETFPDGSRLWRLRFDAPGATDLNLGLTHFRLPVGATFHVTAEGQDYWEGPYTSLDNAPHGELWLPVVPGGKAVAELFVPPAADFEPEIEIAQVGYGFRDWFKLEREIGRQGSCNNDVICPEGDPWRDQIKAVAVYTLNGFWTCTGTMVMNTSADFTPYFLTANHCGVSTGNDQTMVIYWNFESPTCGALCCGSLSDNQTGSIFRASRSDVDFCLVQLEEDPDPASEVFFAGWDRDTGAGSTGSVGIHHPNTDEKAISFNTDALTTMNSCIGGGSQTHWRVNNWEDGTTEPGSSGSGLFDPANKRLIGFLSGGLASCSNINYDCYGKFTLAWNGSSASSRLSDWLDPTSSGAPSLDGSFSNGVGRVGYLAHGGADVCPSNPGQQNGVWEPGETITMPVTIFAVGPHTGITGVLSTTSPGVTITDDTATFPNLTSGATGTSDSPHFALTLDPALTCGATLDFELSLSSAEGGPWVESFSQQVGGDLQPSGLPLPIPDNVPAGAQSSLTVSGTGAFVNDLAVHVVISHTRVGDLVLKLSGPNGAESVLLDRPRYPFFANGCEDDDMDVTFRFTGPSLEQHCPGSTPWYVGNAGTVSPLTVFYLTPLDGTWTLTVEDHNGGETGTVTSWELLTDPVLPAVCDVCQASTGFDPVDTVEGFGLAAPRPNPFSGKTEIRFALERPASTALAVYDVSGRLVRTLLSRDLPAGSHASSWDGRDTDGNAAAAGIYFLRLASDGRTDIRRVNLVR
ncbi:MAG: FlgD immunoglobulin-like domain containing protein [bacterium]